MGMMRGYIIQADSGEIKLGITGNIDRRMTQAVAYCRVSGKGQIEGDGLERQESSIRRYAEMHGIEIVFVFMERGVSGTIDGMERPTWAEMISQIRENGIQTILIEKLDRLARDLMIQEHIIAELGRRGLTLISAAEPDLCSGDASRKLIRQIMGAIAEYDKSMIVARTRAARERIRGRGEKCEGAKAYGTLPGESETVARMKDLIQSGQKAYMVARTLNAEGRKPRRGKQWHAFSVARILKVSG